MKTILCFFLSAISFNILGQSANFEENDQFSVRNVYFFSPTFPMVEGWIDIYKDNGEKFSFNNNYSAAYTFYGINPSPVGYVSNNVIKVGADLDIVLCGNETSLEDLIIKGVASNGFHFPPQQGVIFGDVLRYQMHASDETLENAKVQYFENFKIEWYITSDQNALDPILEESVEWALAGESQNPLYVTFKSPELSLAQESPGNAQQELLSCGLGNPGNVKPPKWGYKWFHSLFKIGCSAADGKNTDQQIIDEIWSKLETLKLEGADSGNTLSYYKDWKFCFSEDAPVNTALLLKSDDAQCGGWARLYIDMLRAQGVTHSSVDYDFMLFRPNSGGMLVPPTGFFVKEWSFTTGVYSNLYPNYPHTLIPEQTIEDGYIILSLTDDQNSYTYKNVYSDGIDEQGVGGQGLNEYPASVFTNHQITNIGNILMDPSYGNQYSDIQDIEDSIIEAYYTGQVVILNEELYFDDNGNNVDLNGDGNIDVMASVYVHAVGLDKSNFSLDHIFKNH